MKNINMFFFLYFIYLKAFKLMTILSKILNLKIKLNKI